MIRTVNMNIAGRALSFRMDFDPGHVSDCALMHYLKEMRLPEAELLSLIGRVLQPGDFAVDVGANVGFFTLVMAGYTGLDGAVLAVEPGVNNIAKLHKNLALNGATTVSVVEQPLWSSETELDFYTYPDSGGNSIWGGGEQPTHHVLKATTLDKLLGDRVPKLIKLDIEGSEVEVLKGAGNVLSRHPRLVFAEMNREALEHAHTSIEEMRDIMLGHGYELFIPSVQGELPTYIPANIKISPTRLNANILFSTLEDVADIWKEAVW